MRLECSFSIQAISRTFVFKMYIFTFFIINILTLNEQNDGRIYFGSYGMKTY